MLIGARLNWLLSHGKGKTWGGKDHKEWGGQQFIQIDISPQEADSNVRIDAPLVGDIGSCVSALLGGDWLQLAQARGAVDRRHRRAQEQEHCKDGRNARQKSGADEFPQARSPWCATSSRPTRTRASSTKVPTRSTSPAASSTCTSRASAWTSALGHHGHRMGFSVAAAVVSGQPVIAIEGDSAFGFSGMEVETICRYNLPVCVRGLQQQRRLPRHGPSIRPAAPTWHPPCSSRAHAMTS